MLFPELKKDDLLELSSLALAHVGDGIYELLARTYVVRHGGTLASKMHRKTVLLVCAKAQAEAAKFLLDDFTQTEKDVFMRGRNSKPKTIPKASTPEEYALATALEAVFGMLYLTGQKDRILELFEKILLNVGEK